MTDELPRTMRAAVLKGVRTVAIEDRSIPQLGPDDVLLEVSHCGVCGSDVHFVIDGWARPETVQGHEWSGRVIAVGDDVTEWEVGDVAVGGPSTKCGVCEHCRAGRASLCTGRDPIGESEPGDGAFAEFIVSRAPELVPIPDGVSLREAALTEPLAVALHGLTRGGVQAGQRLLVTGGGPIGALSVAAAAAGGVTDIVVSEPSPTRRALVERLGAV
ncbi:MAG: zinc-dependent alcohol dehydrogenase, partial [Acidimicrobiia bacterium]